MPTPHRYPEPSSIGSKRMPESSHGAPPATPTTFGSRRSYCTNARKPRARLLSSLCGSLPLRYRPGTSLRRSGTQPMAGTWLLQPSAQPPSSSTQVIATKHQGIFPKDFASIRALPGGGDYTAGAIASFAFDLPYPAVDGNVLRVISRLLASELPIETPWAGSDSAPKRWRTYSPPNFPQANWGKPL